MAAERYGFSLRSYTLVLVPLIGLCLLRGQNVPAQAAKTQEPPLSSNQRNPFEPVPGPAPSPSSKVSGPTIEVIEFQGAKRIPQFALRAVIASRVGGTYDVETLRRDSQALYSTGRFSNIFWESTPGSAGAIVRFMVVERPLIQSIEYQGDNTVSIPEILERFKQRKVTLGVETLYIEDELGHAAAAVQELAAERGRQNITVTPLVEPIGSPSPLIWPPSAVKITFKVEEKLNP